MVTGRDTRTITQKLFSRKREVDNLPMLRGGQEITYPARRNPHSTGSLSAITGEGCLLISEKVKGFLHVFSDDST